MQDKWLVLGLLLCMVISLIVTKIKPSWIFSSATLVAFFMGGIDIDSLANNFTNSSLITLILLIMASCAIEKSRIISWIGKHLTQGCLGYVIAKLGLSTALLSSFTNNTAIVSALIGAIKRNQNHSPSRLLLPLSYAAILGGTLTLIGTSTNLIINSFVVDVGLPSLTFFTPTLIGLSAMVVGLLALIPLSYLLPKSEEKTIDELPYFLEAKIKPGSEFIGKSIAENNLRSLQKLFLAEVVRDNRIISSVSPDLILQENDRLLFCGDVESVGTLQDFSGVTLFGHHHLNGQNFVEVVISQSASLCGNTLKSRQFRDRFDSVVVAIRRGHERLAGGLGDITLRAGDILILAPGKGFEHALQHYSKEFVLINDLEGSAKLSSRKSLFVILGFAITIGLSITDTVPIIKGLVAYIGIMVLLGVITINEISRRFPMDIVIIVGSALSLAQLMQSTGLSNELALYFMDALNGWGPMGALIATYLLTLILTELITNNAAAALVFPIGYSLSQSYGVDPMPFIMAILFGASASFISPYGYQTNLLVYSVGNYKFKDFVKIGIPLSITYSVVVLTLIPLFFAF